MANMEFQFKYMTMWRKRSAADAIWEPTEDGLYYSKFVAFDRARSLQWQSDNTDSGLEYKVVELRDVKGNSE